MTQKTEKRRRQPALPKCSHSPTQGCISNSSSESRDQAYLAFFRDHGEIIRLRRDGKSLEIATGNSRIGVFRAFQKVPSNKLKLQLGIPT
jgi:hypothetical protein